MKNTLAALLLTGSTAIAAPLVGPWYSDSVPLTDTDWFDTLTFPRFDPSTLSPGQSFLGVQYELNGSGSSTYTYENTSPSTSTVTVTLDVSLSVFGPPGTLTTLFLVGSETLPVIGGGSIVQTLSDSTADIGILTGPAAAPFLGMGFVSVPISMDGNSTLSETTGNGIYDIETAGLGDVRIRYLVSDAIPEGAAWIAGLGLLGVACGAGRRILR